MIQYLRLNSTLEAMDNRRNDPEEHRNDLEERVMELHPARASGRKDDKTEMSGTCGISGVTSNVPAFTL